MKILVFNWKDRKNPLAGGAEIITEELLNNQEKYQNLRTNAWQWSKEINFEKSCHDFVSAINYSKTRF